MTPLSGCACAPARVCVCMRERARARHVEETICLYVAINRSFKSLDVRAEVTTAAAAAASDVSLFTPRATKNIAAAMTRRIPH